MPEASYAVHAWEEELGVTLLALGVQPFKTKSKPWAYDGGYPFSEVNPKKQQTGKWAPFNHQKSLDDSKHVIEEAKKKSMADTVVVFNHYPLHWHGCTSVYVCIFFSFYLARELIRWPSITKQLLRPLRPPP